MNNLNDFQNLQFCDLTTTGRRSGHSRTVELWFVVYQDRLYVMAEHHHDTGWVKNLKKTPTAAVHIAGQRLPVRARILSAEQNEQEWHAVAQQFQSKYNWSAGLPVALACERES